MKHFSIQIVLPITAICLFLSVSALKKTTKPRFQSPNILTHSDSSTTKGIVVLELFTSEGCSSCPPADDVLRGLVGKPNVYPLAFHVTYWNRLGWKDSFSQKNFDERQYEYASHFQKEGVYTPQLVVNGIDEFVGSKKMQADNAIKTALSVPATVAIELSKTQSNNSFSIKYKLVGDYKNATLNFAIVESDFETKIMRGENAGRTLKHDNVVRHFETIETQNTEGVYDTKFLKNWNIKNTSLIVFLQDKKTGHIKGANKIIFNSY